MEVRVIFAVALAVSGLWVQADELEVARAALADRLYPIAQTHAEKALRRGDAASAPALLVLLEALSGQGRHAELLERLDALEPSVEKALPEGALGYWRASALLLSGQAQAAAALAEKEAAKASAYADALKRVAARAKQAAGDMPAALAAYAEIDRSTTNVSVRAANALEWALALERAKQVEAALDVLRVQSELATADESMAEGALLRGRLLMRSGKAAEAVKVFDNVAMSRVASESARVQALVEMSVHAWDSGKTNEAVAYARNAYERAQQAETRRLAGFRLGDLLSAGATTIDEAEGVVKALVREFPEHPASMSAQLRLADAFLNLKRPERAASEYRIFLETYPSTALDGAVLQGRGWALMQLGRFTEASGVFQRAAEAVTNDSERAECLFKQGDALLADGRFVEASQVYARLSEAYPLSAFAERALYQSAECLERAAKNEEAGAQYRRVAAQYAGKDVAAKALLRLAAMQAEAADFEEAVLTYTSLVDGFQQKAVRTDALMGRGKVHYRTYRFDAAMQDFAAVAESDMTRRDEARFMLTLCLYGIGRDKEARASAASFLMEFPESPRLADMVLWLGKFDFNRGKYEEARRSFLDHVGRWPDSLWADAALVWAARAAFGASDFTGTVELVTRLVRSYPKSARMTEALLIQVDALMELARFEEAILLADQIMAQELNGEWYQLALLRKADCLFTMGADNSVRYQEALTAYRTILVSERLTPVLTLQLHFKVGRCLEKLKRVDDAIDQYYSEVIVRFQSERARGVWYDEGSTSLFVRSAFNVAELYEQKRQPEQAIRVLQRVLQAGVPGDEDVRQRIERLRVKKAGVS